MALLPSGPITPPELQPVEITDLDILGSAWGFDFDFSDTEVIAWELGGPTTPRANLNKTTGEIVWWNNWLFSEELESGGSSIRLGLNGYMSIPGGLGDPVIVATCMALTSTNPCELGLSATETWTVEFVPRESVPEPATLLLLGLGLLGLAVRRRRSS